MHLKRLEISGFKSFAEKTILEFAPGVTAIVGPNGAGKSNIVDAVRWVMGEQSIKSVRGKKSEDLIFAGSEGINRLGQAAVSLSICNDDKCLPIDYDEVVISRRVSRDGENEYLLNNTSARLKDIAELLTRGRFGHGSYLVISQGMADEILNYSSVQLRALLEEAAGVRIFQLQKEESEKKLERSRENLLQVDAMLAELTPHLNSLRRQVERARKRGELEQKLRELQNFYFSARHSDLDAKRKDIASRKNEVSKMAGAVVAEIKKSRASLEGLQRDFYKQGEILQEEQKELDGLQDERVKLEKEISRLEERIALVSSVKDKEAVKIDARRISQKIKTIIADLKKFLEKADFQNAASYALKNLEEILGETESGFGAKTPESGFNDSAVREKDVLAGKLNLVAKKIEDIKNNLKKQGEGDSRERARMMETERELRQQERELEAFRGEIQKLEMESVRVETLAEELAREAGEAGVVEVRRLETLPSNEELTAANQEIQRLWVKLAEIGGIDPEVEREFSEAGARYEKLTTDSDDIKKSVLSLMELIGELEEKIRHNFDEFLSLANKEFIRMFQTIFGGGKAVLRKVEIFPKRAVDGVEDNTKEEKQKSGGNFGLEIAASLPGKKINDLSLFSGGERSLTALALLFAIIASNPPPFLVLDEVDAALDESNSQRFARMLKEFSAKTQFIIITHNRETMKKAGVIYGVTMPQGGISKILSLKLEEAAEMAA